MEPTPVMPEQAAQPTMPQQPEPQPVQAPVAQAMPTTQVAHKKSSNTLVIILVILGIGAFLCCGIFGALILMARSSKGEIQKIIEQELGTVTPTETTTLPTGTATPNVASLGKVTTATYTFYYPENYVSSPSGTLIQSYQSQIKNDNDAYNTIKLSVLAKPADDDAIPECSSYAESFETTAFKDLIALGNTVTAIDGVSVSRNDMIGCDMMFKITNTKSTATAYADVSIVFKEASTSAYFLGLMYDSKYSDEYEALQAAKNAFTIK